MAGPTATTPEDAAGQRRADKHDARRDELAASALATLAERGYAATSLRDIAQNSAFSHGVVHYYFRDKLELIVYCAQVYADRLGQGGSPEVNGATTADELAEAFAQALGRTLRDHGHVHRLWYDLRAQSMFEPRLREATATIVTAMQQMVWDIVRRYADLARSRPALDPVATFGVLDGLTQLALLAHLRGEPGIEGLREQVRRLMPLLVVPGGTMPS